MTSQLSKITTENMHKNSHVNCTTSNHQTPAINQKIIFSTSPTTSVSDNIISLNESQFCTTLNSVSIKSTTTTTTTTPTTTIIDAAETISSTSFNNSSVLGTCDSSVNILDANDMHNTHKLAIINTPKNTDLLLLNEPNNLPTLPFSTQQKNINNNESLMAATPSSAHFLTNCGPDLINASSQHQVMSDEARALQIALELSMVGLNNTANSSSTSIAAGGNAVQHFQHLQHLQQMNQQNDEHATQQNHNHFDLNVISAAVAAAAVTTNFNQNLNNNSNVLNSFIAAQSPLLPPMDERSKKSQNMTECVPVPSSEHVAEIVGRQGCKIKALRAKTNTYIKTPVRNEEPVFVVTGRKEDVAKAKREILSAAEHFSLIRATRKPLYNSIVNGGENCGINNVPGKTTTGPPNIAGQITIQVRVPYRVVGLVVGPKGATIKHIQQETQTYIVTPSREKEPIFEVTGLPDNVHSARKQIEAHIALRTGNMSNGTFSTGVPNGESPTAIHNINALNDILNDEISSELLTSLYKTGICSNFDYSQNVNTNNITAAVEHNNTQKHTDLNILNDSHFNKQTIIGALPNCNFPITNIKNTAQQRNILLNLKKDDINIISGSSINTSQMDTLHARTTTNNIVGFNNNVHSNVNGGGVINNMLLNNGINVNVISRSCSSASSTSSMKSVNNSGDSSNSSRPELVNIWKNLSNSIEVDEGIGESPNIWTLPTPTTTVRKNTTHATPPTTSNSPTDSLIGENSHATTNNNNLLPSKAICFPTNNQSLFLQQMPANFNTNLNAVTILNGGVGGGARRECLICCEKEVTAALVPCGHNMFCMECANNICATGDATCPVCSLNVYHAMRILA